MKRLTVLAVVASLALAACATGTAGTIDAPSSPVVTDQPAPTDPSPSPSKPPKKKAGGKDGGSSQIPAPQACEAVNGGREAKVANLVDVRVGAHDGYDRVVFEFAPASDGKYFGLPLYEIKAATLPITQDGSGEPVDVDGESFAGIVFHGGSGVEFTDDGYTITYDGPKKFSPGYEALVEATQTGDFEATLSWALGLSEGSCWTVHELEDPLRVAIDFSH